MSLQLGFIIQYNSFWVNGQTMKNLFEELKYICNELKNENEIILMKRYGSNAKRYTAIIILIAIVAIPIVIVSSIWPRILDIIKPKNESRSSIWMQVMTQQFIDQEKYCYLYLFHMNTAFFIGSIATIATGTMLIACFTYACAMFKIASLRIEQAMMANNLQNKFENVIIIYKGIIYAVDVHRKAMEFCKYLISNFEGSFFFLIAIGVLNLSLNLCRIYQIVSGEMNKEQFLVHLISTAITVLYMFIANYIGQEIMDHNNNIFTTAYNVRWYKAPLHAQKLILFLLQMGNKAFGLNVGGLFVASINCFASLVSASISYFTVLYSIQQ
ncbi:PREDICTED: uncharacterized protein LOC105557890 isoform X2 [Vollenhovia emeryi]|uniref:uncharacterized protein LOC105557890 isoform X2 n=1 Tax=Vollenhovia emeryi TaxID=411798 RepID=UPI0005F3FA06|nr:PREDICTED: uncharacterized protein LOC105557890 isoform X2 [Vollenhovia emeryi]